MDKVNYSRTLASIACLKIIMDNNANDFIDAYIPLICEIIRNEKSDEVCSEKLCASLKDFYGLNIPYHAMQAIITRCKTRKILRQEFNRLFVNEEDLWEREYRIDLLSEQNIVTTISDDFLKYAEIEYKEIYSNEKALDIIYNFLNSFDIELIISSLDEFEFPKIRNKEKFIFSNYINKIKNENDEYFSYILKLALGHIFACMICHSNQEAFIGKLKDVTIYIDTPFILKMIGLEGKEKEAAFIDLIKLIQEHGGVIKIFEHTYDEVSQILNDCLFWTNNPNYDPELASNAIRYFVEGNYNEDDVRLFISKLSTTLSQLKIKTNIYIDPNEYKEYQIDENKLFEIITDSYHSTNYVYEDWKKRKVIQRDVQSISNIYRQRKGHPANSMQNSQFLFITTNGALVRANQKFEREVLKSTNKIFHCYNDTFIGTILWLQSPAKIEEIHKKEFLSFCMSQLQPTPEIIKKFNNTLKKLEKMGKLTDEEFYYLRTDKALFNYIVKLANNDADLFDDKSVYETLESIKEKARNEVRPHYEQEKADKEEIKTKYDNVSHRIEKIALFVANLISWSIVILIITIVILCNVFIKTNNKLINIMVMITNILVMLSGFVFGFNLLNSRMKIKKFFYNKILKFFLLH